MKMHVFLAICSQNKATAISLAVLLSSVIGGGCYANTPDGQNAIQKIVKPIPLAAAQAPSTTPQMTIDSSVNDITIQAAKTTVLPTPQETTIATTQETTVVTSIQTTVVEETTTQEKAVATTAQSVQAETVATTAPPVVTTVAPVETTAAPVETTATPVETTAKPATGSLGDLSGTYNKDLAYAVLDLVNQERANAGLPGLTWNGTLEESAAIRATEIVVTWSHTRPDGSKWWTAGSQMQMGENLAYGQTSTSQAVAEWMASPGHAANILRTTFTQMGVSCYICNGTYYWAQHFA